MKISLVTFDDFTDIDLFLAWDVLNRVRRPDGKVSIVGDKESHRSTNGIDVSVHCPLSHANASDVVLFASGKGTRRKIHDQSFLQSFELDPRRQLLGSQCSGALILARLGLLEGIPATTHRTVQGELRALGVPLVDAPIAVVGNVATAGGCLSGLYLAAWVLERTLGPEVRRSVTTTVAPVGEEPEWDEPVSAALRTSVRRGLESTSSRAAPVAPTGG